MEDLRISKSALNQFRAQMLQEGIGRLITYDICTRGQKDKREIKRIIKQLESILDKILFGRGSDGENFTRMV